MDRPVFASTSWHSSLWSRLGWRIDLDYELRALEADSQAETAHRVSIAHGWRDIARGYRMLADFIADAQAADQRRDDN